MVEAKRISKEAEAEMRGTWARVTLVQELFAELGAVRADLATALEAAFEAAFEAGRVAERKDVVAWLHLVLATGCALSVERGKHVTAKEGGSDV